MTIFFVWGILGIAFSLGVVLLVVFLVKAIIRKQRPQNPEYRFDPESHDLN